jgi:hypothetical protein
VALHEITARSFHWLGDESTDGGASWRLLVDRDAVAKIKRQQIAHDPRHPAPVPAGGVRLAGVADGVNGLRATGAIYALDDKNVRKHAIPRSEEQSRLKPNRG